MEFFNLYVFSSMRRATLRHAPPPVAPQTVLPPRPPVRSTLEPAAPGAKV